MNAMLYFAYHVRKNIRRKALIATNVRNAKRLILAIRVSVKC